MVMIDKRSRSHNPPYTYRSDDHIPNASSINPDQVVSPEILPLPRFNFALRKSVRRNSRCDSFDQIPLCPACWTITRRQNGCRGCVGETLEVVLDGPGLSEADPRTITEKFATTLVAPRTDYAIERVANDAASMTITSKTIGVAVG
jgi:hypothetical protein